MINIIHKIFSEVAIYKKTLHKDTSQLLVIVLQWLIRVIFNGVYNMQFYWEQLIIWYI